MTSRSSISDFRSAFLAIAGALATIFAVDFVLHRQEVFTRAFGENSHDGQDLSKLRRARAYAESADVMVFGGSFVRYGVSGKPMRDAGVLFWNNAFSGGGPISSLLALRNVAPIVAERAEKPVILLETFRYLLQGRQSAWGEFVHINGLARSWNDVLPSFGVLLRHGLEVGATEKLLLQTVIPSSMYRTYLPQLATIGISGYWWYGEDESGYAAVYDKYDSPIEPGPFVKREDILPSKLLAMKEFVTIAKKIGARVVFMSTPSLENLESNRDQYEDVYQYLTEIYPGIEFVRMRDYRLTKDDFSHDGWGHPNTRGADKISSAILRQLNLQPTAEYEQKRARLIKTVNLAEDGRWTSALVPKIGPDKAIQRTPYQGSGPIFTYEVPGVPAGTELVAELQAVRRSGTLQLCVGESDEIPVCQNDTLGGNRRLEKSRVYSRYRSTGNPIIVNVIGYEDAEGEITGFRLVQDLAGAW